MNRSADPMRASIHVVGNERPVAPLCQECLCNEDDTRLVFFRWFTANWNTLYRVYRCRKCRCKFITRGGRECDPELAADWV